jgi:serine/threonine protein kinase
MCGWVEILLPGYEWMVGLFTVLVMPIYTCLDTFLEDYNKDALHIFKKGLESLYRFHQTGYVHCDLKWGNIMASASSEAAISSKGVEVVLSDVEGVKKVGDFQGMHATYQYMPISVVTSFLLKAMVDEGES